MTTDMFVRIVLSVVTIISVLISAYILPFIKEKLDSEKLNQLRRYTIIAVQCAEQIFTKEQWQEKKTYVKEYLIDVVKNKLNIDLSEADIDTIIEGIVYEVKRW